MTRYPVMVIPVGLLALVLGCTSKGAAVEGASPTAGVTASSSPTLAAPLCSDVFKVDAKIDPAKAAESCADARGGLHAVGSFECSDGRSLFQADANTGAREGWGFGGDVYHAARGPVADDATYSRAYHACVG